MMNMNETEQTDFNALFDLILSEEAEIPISKLYQLSDLPQNEFDRFMNRWPSTSDDRREQVARHMADISEENFVVDFAPYARLMLKDDAAGVRLAALDMLWDNSSVSFIDPVIERMVKDEDDDVRASAAASLGHYLLMMQWGEINRQFEQKIQEVLLEQIRGVFTPKPVRRAALEAISSGDLAEVPDLIQQAYTSDDPQMRLSAVFAMGRSADDRWVHNIATELESDDEDMRVEASRAAGNIGKSDFAEQLSEIAKFDDHLEAQIAAIYALAQIGNETAAKTLDEIVNDEDYADLHEIADEAMEEMMVMGLDIDLPIFELDENDLDDRGDEDLLNEDLFDEDL